ncbi:hypothetical protein [Propionivibrio sp.]|nr:hypothetical protein [Propionivibrio sp.]
MATLRFNLIARRNTALTCRNFNVDMDRWLAAVPILIRWKGDLP